jgi:hypothetical protein
VLVLLVPLQAQPLGAPEYVRLPLHVFYPVHPLQGQPAEQLAWELSVPLVAVPRGLLGVEVVDLALQVLCHSGEQQEPLARL